MKIIHFADLHLGVENYGHIDPATGLSSRLLDILTSLDRLVDYAVQEQVDLIIFCGDAYRSREPSQTHQREFARRISRLSDAGIPVFLLTGNHDLPNAAGRATSTEIFSTLGVKNVWVSSRPEVCRIPTNSGDVQVASLPWLRRGALLSREDTRNLNFDQINERMQAALSNIIDMLAGQVDPALPSVLAAHVWVAGATLGTEKMMTIGQEHTLLLSTVANRAFDYVALGHIHGGQVLFKTPPVVYSGSLDRLDFGDEDDEKGFYLVDIREDVSGKRSVGHEFHPVEGRRFLTISVTVEEQDPDPLATVLAEIERNQNEVVDAIIRLQLTIPASVSAQLPDVRLREALKTAYFLSITRDIRREARIRLGTRTAEGLTPLDALKLWLESKNTPPDRTETLLDYGRKLVEGETEKE